LTRDFRKQLKDSEGEDVFFKEVVYGRKKLALNTLDDMIIGLRKNNFSTEDIVGIINSKGYNVTYGYVYSLLKRVRFMLWAYLTLDNIPYRLLCHSPPPSLVQIREIRGHKLFQVNTIYCCPSKSPLLERQLKG